MEYQVSDEVRKVAEPLIKNFHSHLNGLTIVYLFQNKRDKRTGAAIAPRSKGKALLGQAKLVTGLSAFLVSGATRTDGDEIEPFFVLLITKFTWDKMKAAQRQALVDHELCHMGIDDDSGRPVILPHDVTEFNAIVRRHGLWSDDVQLFFKSAKQMPLPLEAKNIAVRKAAAAGSNGNGAGDKAKESSTDSNDNGDKPGGIAELKKAVARKRAGAGVRAQK